MDPSELQASIEAARNGQAEGYQALLNEYNPRLYGYFYRITANRHDAEDLLCETVLRLVRMLPQYTERGRFEPWLFRIAANLVRDRFRRMKTAPKTLSLSGAADTDGPSYADRLAGPADPVDARLELAEATEQVMAAMGELDASTRNMILLRHFAELSFAEVAEVMGCPLGTALAKVHRGLKALRRKLAPEAERTESEMR